MTSQAATADTSAAAALGCARSPVKYNQYAQAPVLARLAATLFSTVSLPLS